MKRLLLICGPDGAGKTTLANLLSIYYKSKGYRVVIGRIRGTHTLASILARGLRQRKAFKGHDVPFFNIRIPDKIKKLWLAIEFVSVIPYLLLYYILYPTIGYLVIMERSHVDFLVWLLYILKSRIVFNCTASKALLVLTRKVNSICLIADINELIERKKEEEFLIKGMYNIYKLFLIYNRCIIDTTKYDHSKTFIEVLNCLNIY